MRNRDLTSAVGAYVAFVVLLLVALRLLADRWWPATALLFAPRWIAALPLLLLLPAAYLRRRRLIWPLTLAGLVVLGPLMGWQVPVRLALLHRAQKPDVRVLSYNIGGGPTPATPLALRTLLAEVRPDVAAFQECNVDLDLLMAAGWFVHSDRDLCLCSRFPIRTVTERDRSDVADTGSGAATAYQLQMPDGPATLVNIHLATVRHGLSEVMHRLWRGIPDLRANIDMRRRESQVVHAFVEQQARKTPGRTIVTGDFNIPPDSTIYAEVWSHWTNAFSAAGWGFGWSKFTRWHGIRIDQVLVGAQWNCTRAWAGPTIGFDHRAVVADLVRAGAPAGP